MNSIERAKCIIDRFNRCYRPIGCCCSLVNNIVPGNTTLTIGTVTTGEPGSDATASITGRNPAGNPAALTITPSDGGTNPVAAHLVITKLN